MAKSNFIVRGGADFSGIKKEINKTEKQFKGFKATLNSGLKSFGKLAGITIGVRALYDFGKASIKVASDLNEVQNVVDVTFGSMASDINDFADTAIKQFGMSELAAKKYSSTMGAMLKSSGISGKAVRDMSLDLTALAADMASFYNLDNDVAFEKIMSGMAGMSRPLRDLGINMNVANLEAFAMSQGINRSWQEMNQAEQTILRYNYLLHSTKDAQGDFARTVGDWENQTRILKMQWQEFMSLIGEALIKILLPVVKSLNKVLDILIKIGEKIKEIYAMITGKKVDVKSTDNVAESNIGIEDTAFDAAKGEEDLAKGIEKAKKAAKGALTPFDELNILQQNLGSGGGSGNLDGIGNLNPEINTEINTNKVADSITDGIRETQEETNKFFIWFGDKWNKLKQALMIPIQVPAPVFAAISDPIYKPNWGLELPPIQKPIFQPIPNPIYNPNWNLAVPEVDKPEFQPIPNPVYNPNWGLELPLVSAVEIPPINYEEYIYSLEEMKIKAAETYQGIKAKATEHINSLKESRIKLWGRIQKNTETETGKINTSLVDAWNIRENNFKIHKENVGTIATGIATALVTNINAGLSTMGQNTNKTIQTVQTNLQTFGKSVATIAGRLAKSFAGNLSEGFKVASQNFATFANTVGENLKAFGSGFLRASAETAKGFASNMVNGFAKVWENFKNLMSGIGEKVSGWFSANKSVITKVAIGAGIAVGVGALTMLAPAAIPYAAGALGGLATVPALAKGGITESPMLAMVGDNPGGREVVSPLDDLMGMIKEAVSSSDNNNSGNTTLIIKIGEDTITEKVISNINRKNRISGKTVITV